MKTSIFFQGHSDFQRSALFMTLGGALCALLLHALWLVYPGFGAANAPFSSALLGSAVAYLGTPWLTNKKGGGFVVLFVVLFSALNLWLFGSSWLSIGALFTAMSLGGLLWLEKRSLADFVIAALAFGAARFVLEQLISSEEVASFALWESSLLYGASFGFVATLGLLPRHLSLRTDKVSVLWARLGEISKGEMKDLLARAVSVKEKLGAYLEADSPVRQETEAATLRLLEVAQRWELAAPDGLLDSEQTLTARIQEVEQKLSKAQDPITVRQYEQTKGALLEQRKHLKEINTQRERVIAGMHRYVTALECLRFAVINQKNTSAAQLQGLESLGQELDIACEAIQELERD
jgi:hypothetical protein